MKRVTLLGLQWELLHSFWMLLIFTPMTLPFCYFYVGVRLHKQGWINLGYFYFILLNGGSFLLSYHENFHDDVYIFTFIGMMLVFFNGFIYAFSMRKEYLVLLTERVNSDIKTALIKKETERQAARKRQRPANVRTRNEAFKYQSSKIRFANTQKERINEPRIININEASLEEISVLPGLHAFLARSIVNVREKEGSFHSINHLASFINIKPYLLDQASPFITFSAKELNTREKEAAEEAKEARKKKSYKKDTGRRVDY